MPVSVNFKKYSPLDLFLMMFILMYYGRLSVVLFIPQYEHSAAEEN